MDKETELRLSKLEARVATLEVLSQGHVGFGQSGPKFKKTSAKEFLMTKQIKTETQKVLALGFYLEHLDGLASFNVADLEAVFRSAKERLPKNMNDAVNKNVARGLLMEAAEKKDSKKSWVLTITGEKCVEEELKKYQ